MDEIEEIDELGEYLSSYEQVVKAPEPEISPRFDSFLIASWAQERIQELRLAFSLLEREIEAKCIEPRLKAMALSHLEMTCLLAIKSIVHAKEAQI